MTGYSQESAWPGLTTAEAEEKLVLHGPNVVGHHRRFRPFLELLQALNNPLLWVVMGASIVSYLTGEHTNAIILVAMVGVSVALDYANTFRSERAIEVLRNRVVTKIRVLRDHRETEVPLEKIVPGDVALLSAGNVIPADGYVVSSRDVHVNESVLTGESMPVEKSVVPGPYPSIVDRRRPDAVFLGTSVVTGFARILVVTTGRGTVYGGIAGSLESREPQTDFDREIRLFSVFLMRLTFVMVALVFFINIIVGREVLDSTLFAIAVAIGLTPELLPIIMTVSLSRGAVRMAGARVIVKRLPAIQNLGRMDLICTDKTGTLTKNQIAVFTAVDADGNADDAVLRFAYFGSRLHTGVPHPLDAAIISAKAWSLQGIHKIAEEPFDFERKRSSLIIRDENAATMIVTGAPETLLPVCKEVVRAGSVWPMNDRDALKIHEMYDRYSRDGMRVLAIGTRLVSDALREYEADAEKDLVFRGFVVLSDPPKQSARQAIESLADLGVGIKILTGDGLEVTEKVCRDLGILVQATYTGEQLAALGPEEWPRVVRTGTIFARIDPAQKERIITTLRGLGHVVGFMGDGINDAPALKAADVGISVSNAVDVARETADMILLEPSLQVLRDGVIEGRKTFHNTLKYLKMVLSSNFGNMFSMVVASGFLPFLPMRPTQILLNNFLYDTSQLALSGDRVDERELRRPTIWSLPFVRHFMLVFGPISSAFDILTFFLLFGVFRLEAGVFQSGWFFESLATQVLVVFIMRTSRSPFWRSRPSRGIVLNCLVVMLVALVLLMSPWGKIFGFTPMPPTVWAVLIAVTLADLALMEIAKRWFVRKYSPTLEPS